MIHLKTLFYTALLLLVCTFCYTKELDSRSLDNSISLKAIDSVLVSTNEIKGIFQDSISTASSPNALPQKKDSFSYPPKFRDYRRLGYNSLLYAGTTVVVFGVLYTMPESVTHWDKEAMKENGIFWKWKQNVKAGPLMDQDSFFINYVTHPYSGAVYYMTARSCGFNIFESFGYSTIMSTFFWEYGIEAFAEIPSTQDLIITPVLGSLVGEGFFYAKKSIVRNDKRVLKSRFLGITTLFLIDPFNSILDGFGFKEKVKTQMNIAPVGFDASSNKTVWGVNFSASF